MNKGIVLLLAGLSFCLAPVSYAEPVDLTGEASVKYERDASAGDPDTSGIIYTFKLTGETDLGSGWSLYARMGVQRSTRPELGDYNIGYYGENDKAVAALDQFGVIFKEDNLTYKLGRQDATVGTTALLYCRKDAIGRKGFVDGLSVAGTIDDTEISALLAREDNPAGQYKNKVYALRAGFRPRGNFNWGLTLGHYQGSESTNHWAVDGTAQFDENNSVTGEYTQSSSADENRGLAITWNYVCDGKTTLSLTGFRLEDKGDMGEDNSDFDSGNRGWHYGITHNLRDDLSLEMLYKNQRAISDGAKNTALEAVLSYSF